jgi:cold-inducible RNA-binding protein
MAKLFVGNLPWKTTDEELKQLFSEAGTVAAAEVIRDKFTGRSRGFGFVEMSSDEESQKALELNGKEIEGRALTVNEARPKADRPAGGGGGGGFRDRRPMRDSY